MRAVVVHGFGGPEVLETVEVPVPEPGPGQLRVRVEAATVNPVDALVRTGGTVAAGMALPRAVYGLGWDVAGTVDALGPGVAGFAAGDRVIGLIDRLDLPLGGYAEYAVLEAAETAAAPPGVSAVEAATLPLNGLTAWQGLDLLDLPAGSTLLVGGAVGGVGGFAVQLAVERGLRVVAVAGRGDDADAALARRFGAAFVVPRDTDVAAAVRAVLPGGVDGVLDTAPLGVTALEALRGGGAFVSCVPGAAPVARRRTRVENVWVGADGAALGRLAALAGRGRLTLRVAGTFPLERAADAHTRLAAGGLRGRLVLVP
ncbi:NADP-dependent oxidoreductase [Streptomyces sp. NPDC018031]|uniref:NADP-dependent oxidoreductase n=1 Tax=Streptomyces sp. NPDC018031 TaxID=3365033 RepID=UPI003799C146